MLTMDMVVTLYGLEFIGERIAKVAKWFDKHEVKELEEAHITVSNMGDIMDGLSASEEFSDDLALFFAIEGMRENHYLICEIDGDIFVRYAGAGTCNVYDEQINNYACFTVMEIGYGISGIHQKRFREQCQNWINYERS